MRERKRETEGGRDGLSRLLALLAKHGFFRFVKLPFLLNKKAVLVAPLFTIA